MVLTAAVVAVTLLFAAIEVPALIRKRWIRETVVFAVLALSGIALAIADARHLKLPSPLGVLRIIYEPISRLFFH